MDDAKRFNEWFINEIKSSYSIHQYNILYRLYTDSQRKFQKESSKVEENHKYYLEKFKDNILLYGLIAIFMSLLLGYFVRDKDTTICSTMINNGFFECESVSQNTSVSFDDCIRDCAEKTPILLYLFSFPIFFMLFEFFVR